MYIIFRIIQEIEQCAITVEIKFVTTDKRN